MDGKTFVKLRPVTLVQAEEDDEDDDEEYWKCSNSLEDEDEIPTFNIPHFRFIDDDEDDEDEDDDYVINRQRWSGSCSTCSSSDEEYPCDSSSSALFDRYVVVSGTPHKILEHLLSDLRLDEHQGAAEGKEAGERLQTHHWGNLGFAFYLCNLKPSDVKLSIQCEIM